ncbi:MAG: lipocalin-like domain-containing protein [Bacteroidetes bacterium]|nr:lipocalin-like domain-containing protein [Bacteroidota bacterium]
MKYLLSGFFLMSTLIQCSSNRSDTMEKFRGMWKLDKYESYDSATNSWLPSLNRQGYTGYILYDGIGHMGVQLIPPGFSDFDADKPIDSLDAKEQTRILKLQLRSFIYFADAKIIEKENSIEHHKLLSNDPIEWGTTSTRNFEFRGDTLILTAKELIAGLKTRLRWVKCK